MRHPQHGGDGHGPGGPTEGYEEMHRQQGDHDALWTRHYWGEWSKDKTATGTSSLKTRHYWGDWSVDKTLLG